MTHKYPKPLLMFTALSTGFIIIGFISFLIGAIAGALDFAFEGFSMLVIGLLVLNICLWFAKRYENGKKSI